MASILKGAPVAGALSEELINRVNILKSKGVTPTLAMVRVGNRSDDISYEKGAIKRCEKIGIEVKKYELPDDCDKENMLDVIREINENDDIHGCLMFRPLVNKEIERAACELLNPAKDVDGMTQGALAKVFTGQGMGYPPCTAQACIEILDYYDIELTGKRVTVIGRSLVIGKPVSMMLQSRNATVTMCHTRTIDMPSICKEAEIIVAAAGKASVVDANFVSEGQVVIDVGINVDDEGNLCGDVKFDEVEPLVDAITPVPAGVGSVTTAVLCKHVIESAENNA